jgi:hypothetical protein
LSDLNRDRLVVGFPKMLDNAKQVSDDMEVQYKYKYGLLIIVLHYK